MKKEKNQEKNFVNLEKVQGFQGKIPKLLGSLLEDLREFINHQTIEHKRK